MWQFTARSSGTYVFGPFKLSADGTLLLRASAPVRLPPKVLQTLLVLVREAGRVVTKGELLQEVWPHTYVEEGGISRNISELRKALGPDGRQAIVTVATVGYRFDLPVRRVPSIVVPTGPPTRGAIPLRGEPLVVGREQELDALLAAFDDAERDAGRLVAITGEAGIGKSTVAEQLLRAVGGRCRIGRGRCSRRLSEAEPHLPLLEALQDLSIADPEALASLRRIAPTWFPSVAPEMATDEGGGQVVDRRGGSAIRLLHELTRFLDALSRDRPVVVVLEDVHWSDVATVDAIAHLAPRVQRLPVLLIVTYRLAELHATGHPLVALGADLIARGELQVIALPLLPLDAVRQYVSATLAAAATDIDLPLLVHRRTEGNPLFMVDLVRYLHERQTVVGNLDADAAIPGSLKALIEHTLALLPEEVRALLSLGAIQGYEFDSTIVADVSAVGPVVVEERLRRAQRLHGLLAELGEHTLPDGRTSLRYRFVHVLYQETLFGAIVPAQRTEWARAVGMAILRAHAGLVHVVAGQLAVLFDAGREPWLASEHYLAASRNAARRFAFHEAEHLSRQGLACLQQVRPATDEALARETDLAFACFVAVAALEGFGSNAVEALARRLRQLSEALDDDVATASALSAQWAVHMARGECQEAREAAIHLEQVGQMLQSPVLLINARMQAQTACHHLGEFVEADRYTELIQEAAPTVTVVDRLITIYDPVVASLAESSRNAWITGRWARADAHSAAAVALAREFGHPDSISFALLFDGWLRGYRLDWAGAEAVTMAAIEVCEAAGTVQTLAWNRCVHGWAVAHIDRLDDGIAEITDAIEGSRRIFGWVAMPQFMAMLAECLLLGGRPAEAERWIRDAQAFVDTHHDDYFSAELERLAGCCEVALGRTSAGRASLVEAVAMARSQGAVTFELRAALDLWPHAPDQARQALRHAVQSLPEPSPWPDLIEAMRLSR